MKRNVPTNIYILYTAIILPWLAIGIYNLFQLDTRGGFLEQYEVVLKSILLGIIVIGTGCLTHNTVSNKALDRGEKSGWLILAGLSMVAALGALWVVLVLGNGIGF